MTIEITYRQTSRLSMRIVKNGDVHVSAPLGMARDEIEKFIADNTEWIGQARQRRAQRQQHDADFYAQLPLNTREQCDDALRRLKALITPMVEHHARRMGVQPKSIYYSATTSRWGVCYPKRGRIGFSVYLLLLPEWCAEHVVVHELCHLLEPSHNDHFHALMNHYYPLWHEARAETRRICRGAVSDEEEEEEAD